VCAVSVLAVSTGPREASANISAPIVRESMVAEPAPIGPTKLVIAGEDLSFDCYTRRAIAECTMRAAYRIANPTRRKERVDAAFATYDASEIAVTIDGAVAPTVAVQPSDADATSKAVNARVGFTVEVAPGQTRTVVVTGTVPLGRIHQPKGYIQPPAKAWHPWAGQAADFGSFTLDYLMAPINTWAAVGEITITVRHASWWSLHGVLLGTLAGQPERQTMGWVDVRDGNAMVSTTKTAGRQRERLSLELTPLPPIIENGGAFVGVGGRPGTHGGLRTRVGYEVAIRQIGMASLSLESDLARIMQIVPAVELATPTLLILPSVGIGVGTAIQVQPDVRASIRLEGSIHWFPLGFLTAVDFFPIPNKAFDPSIVRVTLLGQFSF
jgi:hypothetical protein